MFKSMLVIMMMYSSVCYSNYKDYMKDSCSTCKDIDKIYSNVIRVSKETKVDKKTILAIIKLESTFKSKVSSRTNYGLMGVNIKHHGSKFRGSYTDIYNNIKVGTTIYKDCYEKYKSKDKALACYKTGNTSSYISKINRELSKMKEYD